MPRGPTVFKGPVGLQSIYDEYNNFDQFKLEPFENNLTDQFLP